MSVRLQSTLIFALVIGVTIASPALARIRPGIEAGANISTFNYDETPPFWDSSRWRSSFTAGGVLEFALGERFAVTTGLSYVQHGNSVKYHFGTQVYPGEFRVNYVSVPVLLEFHPNAARGLFVSLGPDLGFLVSARAIFVEPFFSTTRTVYTDIYSELERSNFSIDAGVGYDFPLENHMGVVQVRYTHGFTGIAEKDHWFSDWYTRGILCMAGLRW